MRWSYTLLIFHIGSAVALFYLLKFVQDKLIASFAKRGRTAFAALALAAAFGSAAMLGGHHDDPYGRMPEAAPAADYLRTAMAATDRLCTSPKWEHALGFQLLVLGKDEAFAPGPMQPGQGVFLAMEKPSKLGVDLVLLRCGVSEDEVDEPRIVRDWPRLEIFAARKR